MKEKILVKSIAFVFISMFFLKCANATELLDPFLVKYYVNNNINKNENGENIIYKGEELSGIFSYKNIEQNNSMLDYVLKYYSIITQIPYSNNNENSFVKVWYVDDVVSSLKKEINIFVRNTLHYLEDEGSKRIFLEKINNIPNEYYDCIPIPFDNGDEARYVHIFINGNIPDYKKMRCLHQ